MLNDDGSIYTTKRPFGNSYWVEPGRVLAGEYPGGADLAETQARLQALADCGVRCFIDLTRARENIEYASLLDEIVGGAFEHHRFPIEDHGVPDSPKVIASALDAIDAAQAKGQVVYVHCRAGIGRTGMTVAAYLMRRGYSNVEAFDRLQLLWQQCARSNRWPIVPETQEQIDYVHSWQDPRSQAVAGTGGRIRGALLGLIVGDSLLSSLHAGQPVDAERPQPLDLPSLLYADSAQAIAATESLALKGSFDPDDQLRRYQSWVKTAPSDPRVSVPDALKRAIASWQWSRKPYAGTHDPRNLDAHSIARCIAAVICFRDSPDVAMDTAVELSRTSQQSPVVLDLCRIFAATVLDALSGANRQSIAQFSGEKVRAVRGRKLRPEVIELIEAGSRPRRSEQNAIAVFAHAINTFAAATDFQSGLRMLVEMKVAASAAAIYGAIAGAHEGDSAIPKPWLQNLPQAATDVLTRLRT